MATATNGALRAAADAPAAAEGISVDSMQSLHSVHNMRDLHSACPLIRPGEEEEEEEEAGLRW